MSPIDLITVTREFGAGGSQLAEALGERLGWRVLDQGIVPAVAARLGVEPEDVAAHDEHAPGVLERIGSAVLRSSPDFAPSLDVLRLPAPEDIADATRAELLEAAAAAPVIIVGHGAQALFHDRPGTLHLRLVAPLRSRLHRICARIGCGDADAAGLARRMDADRVTYVRRYYQRDWHDPLLYHLQINTGEVGLPEATRLVVDLVETRRTAAAAE